MHMYLYYMYTRQLGPGEVGGEMARANPACYCPSSGSQSSGLGAGLLRTLHFCARQVLLLATRLEATARIVNKQH